MALPSTDQIRLAAIARAEAERRGVEVASARAVLTDPQGALETSGYLIDKRHRRIWVMAIITDKPFRRMVKGVTTTGPADSTNIAVAYDAATWQPLGNAVGGWVPVDLDSLGSPVVVI